MAALADIDFVAMEAPELSGGVVGKNGVTFNNPMDFFQAMLDTNGGSKELALAQIFRILTTEDRNGSLQLGEFSCTRRAGMTFDRAREYWEEKYRATLFGSSGVVPTVVPGGSLGLPIWPMSPAVR